MKTPPSLRKKSEGLRLRLNIQHSRLSRALLTERRLKRAARSALTADKRRGRFTLSLAFVSDTTMQSMNRAYAGNDYTTDVLSFAALEDSGCFRHAPTTQVLLGDIAISLAQAKRQAKTAGHSLAREVDLLIVHGVLHLLGYDHGAKREAAVMNALQEHALRQSRIQS